MSVEIRDSCARGIADQIRTTGPLFANNFIGTDVWCRETAANIVSLRQLRSRLGPSNKYGVIRSRRTGCESGKSDGVPGLKTA